MRIIFSAFYFGLMLVNIFSFGINDSIPGVLINEKINIPYSQHYSVPREQVYIHFNKSGYLPGETIWFTAYVFNPSTGLQSKLTTNLYVELFDPSGKLLAQKNLFVKQGIAFNDFISKSLR